MLAVAKEMFLYYFWPPYKKTKVIEQKSSKI